MQYEVKDAGTWKKQVTVKVPKEEIAKKQKEILHDLRTSMPVPGFRIGHAPDAILEIRFRDDIKERLKGAVLSESAGEAVEKGQVKAVTMPNLKHDEITVIPTADLEYSFTVEVRPEFELPEYKGLKVESPSQEIADADLEKALEAMRYRVAEYKTIEEPAAAGDIIVGDYKITSERKTVKEEKETALGIPKTDDEEKNLIGVGDLPIEGVKFVGAKAGEDVSEKFTFPETYADEAHRGKKATFHMKVHEVRRHSLPEVNDEFAKRVGAENLDSLKSALRNRIAADKKDAAEHKVQDALVDILMSNTKFELPEELLKSEKERRQTRAILQLSRMGVTPEVLKKQTDKIQEETAKSAERELRKTFIFSAIAEKEKIEVGEEEVEERIDTLARYWNTTPVAARSRLAESGGLTAIYEDILEEKVMAILKQNAQITSADKKE